MKKVFFLLFHSIFKIIHIFAAAINPPASLKGEREATLAQLVEQRIRNA